MKFDTKTAVLAMLVVAGMAGIAVASTTTLVDDFDDEDLSTWSGNTGKASIITSPSGDGSSAVKLTSTNNYNAISSTEHEMGPGENMTFHLSRGSGATDNAELTFGANGNDRYRVLWTKDGQTVKIGHDVAGTTTWADQAQTSGVDGQTIYHINVDWSDDGVITMRLSDPTGAPVTTLQMDEQSALASSGPIGLAVNNANEGTGEVILDRIVRVDEVNRPPVISDVTVDSTTVGTNWTATFDVTATDPDDDPISFAWDFDGDGESDATGQSVEHAFAETGEHTVIVTADDGENTTTSQATVYVADSTGTTEVTNITNVTNTTVVEDDDHFGVVQVVANDHGLTMGDIIIGMLVVLALDLLLGLVGLLSVTRWCLRCR